MLCNQEATIRTALIIQESRKLTSRNPAERDGEARKSRRSSGDFR